MTLPKRGARQLTVGGVEYRWTWAALQVDAGFVAEAGASGGSQLVVTVGTGYLVTAPLVAGCIERALAQGWKPEEPGPRFRLECAPELLPDARSQCPCCDCFSLPPGRGGYEICPVCSWEDDGSDLDRGHQHSGPNHMTLAEGRAKFLETGVGDTTEVRSERTGRTYRRSPRGV